MKNTFAQIQLWVSRIDRRHLQLAYFALALAAATALRSPSDGGGGPF
jgi:hypothetical protein